MGDFKKFRSRQKNPDHVDLLEDLTSTGTCYLDLRNMTFT